VSVAQWFWCRRSVPAERRNKQSTGNRLPLSQLRHSVIVNRAKIRPKLLTCHKQWRDQEFSFEEAIAKGFWGGSPPIGSRGKAPVGGLGDEVSQKLKQFADIVYIF